MLYSPTIFMDFHFCVFVSFLKKQRTEQKRKTLWSKLFIHKPYLFLSTFQVSQWDYSFWWNFFLCECRTKGLLRETKRNYWKNNNNNNTVNKIKEPTAHWMGCYFICKVVLVLGILARVQNEFFRLSFD